jgi:hypothetical protein
MAESNHEEAVKQALNAEQEERYKSGLRIFGYIVPWWVVIVVLLLLLYVLYDQGHLSSVMGTPRRQVALADSPSPVIAEMRGGVRFDTVGVETPKQMRQLFGY